MAKPVDAFDKLVWRTGQMLLDDLVFDIDDHGLSRNEPAEAGLPLLKPRRMLDQYARFWRLRKDFSPANILELGIHAGGSIAFWFEVFQPARLVAIDIAETGDSMFLDRYLMSRGLQSRITTYWNTSQTDSERLKQIVASDFAGALDLVFDDASHVYQFTKTSFETLFPLLRPGGFYIIEDWSWACWPGLPVNFNPSMTRLPVGLAQRDMPLPRLICEIVVAAGKMEKFLSESQGFLSLKPVIADVHVYPDFVAIERGEADRATIGHFKLERGFSQRQQGEVMSSVRRAVRAIAMLARRSRVSL